MCERAAGARRSPRWTDPDGSHHWLVVPDWQRLADTAPAVAIGFFGQARENVEHGPIITREHEILARADGLQGLLAYHNVRFADGQWGNLVVFASADDPSRLRADPVHVEAIGLTPRHYHSLRLHVGTLELGALGEAEPRLIHTLYLDFATPPWRAMRYYTEA